MNKTEVLSRLANSRQALLAALQEIPVEEWQQPGVEGHWGIRDLVAHISTWEDSVLIPLRDFAQGGEFAPAPIPDHLAWNDEQELRWRQSPFERATQELVRIRAEILDLLEGIEDSRWEVPLPAPWGGTGTLVQILGGLVWHEDEHTRSILRWQKEKDQ